MKTFLYIILLLISAQTQAQNNVLDYLITTTNDTVFGVIKDNKLYKTTKDSAYIYSISKAKAIRKNDVIYKQKPEDYKAEKHALILEYKQFISTPEKEQDYIVTSSLDTVYGTIKDPFIGAKYIKQTSNKKVKICKKESISYRKDNAVYHLKQISKPILSISKDIYLKRIYKGKASLYKYKTIRSDVEKVDPKTYYIIEKSNKLHLISNSNYKQQLIDLFIDNITLTDKIDNDFYSIENIYLIMKYYDLN